MENVEKLPVRKRTHVNIKDDSLSSLYQHDLLLYLEPPSSMIQLSEFEDLAIARLQLLRIIDEASLKGIKIYTLDWKDCIKDDLNKAGLKQFVRLLSGANGKTELDYQARRVDHISHFILRLAYCRSEGLRLWFLSKEMEWFRLKFMSQPTQGVKAFLSLNNLKYTPISDQEKQHFKKELIASTAGISATVVETSEFFKIPFTEVLPLIENRKVFLRKGIAYVPWSEMLVCIQSVFRASLNEALNVYYHRLPKFNDDRINAFLQNLNDFHTGNNYSVKSDNKDYIDPNQMDKFAKNNFPLCMQNIHKVLRANHHLKHHCRLQYGLFLKGIGLLYEDAVKFWQSEFTKSMDIGKFEKQYLYNIKHQYGLAGNRVNYSPYSCIKIIKENVAPGEHHGCPFKHWDPDYIKQQLIEKGLSSENCSEIKDLATKGHYQIACTKYFEYKHGKAPSTGINHPNHYFDESRNIQRI